MKKVSFFILLLFAAIVKNVDAQIISTIAGNGSSTHSGDGGPATAAGVPGGSTSGIVNSNGDYFFCELHDNRVRKVSSSGVISTFAGTGIGSYGGDGGPATAAMLNNPWGVTIDTAGNIYVGEGTGSRVRKIDASTGIITTFAGNGTYAEYGYGGLATAAAFGGAICLCFDKFQNLYITDGYYKVRKVDGSTGIITTYAGSPTSGAFSGDGGSATAAEFNQPMGICTDTFGNLYIADWGNARIRGVNAVTGIITTIAGNGSYLYNGEGVPATAAQINPFDIKVDNFGNIVFADRNNYRVRQMNASSGLIVTLGGSGVTGFAGDGGPATAAKTYQPNGIAIDKCNEVYFPDNGNGRIRKITSLTGKAPTITIVANTGNNLCYHMPVAFTAQTTLAGSAPTYQWQVNGVNVGASTPTYTYTPANGDSIQCLLTSNLYCVIDPHDTSNVIHIAVDTFTPPTISITGDTVAGTGTTANLSATIIGTAGVYLLHWKNHGVEFATTTGPSVTYTKAPGTDTITVELAATGRGCYDSAVSNMHSVYDHNVSVSILQTSFSSPIVYPNPASDMLNIKEQGFTFNAYSITNSIGTTVLTNTITNNVTQVNIKQLPAGLYFVNLKGEQGNVVRKFVKM